jgi:7-carboxy-7-deazaguanine synthase
MERPAAGQLVVAEIFGPTLQGEGPDAGTAAAFLRLGMCHLDCQWCDTRYTWDAQAHDLTQELTGHDPDAVVERLLTLGSSMVVVTGGEPLLQRMALVPVLRALHVQGVRIQMETSGTVAPGPVRELVDSFVVSPKLEGSGVARHRRRRPEVLLDLMQTGRAVLKFVICGEADLAEADALVADLRVAPDDVWIMPEGTASDQVLSGMRALAPHAIARGWHLSPRLQVLLWEDRRGV